MQGHPPIFRPVTNIRVRAHHHYEVFTESSAKKPSLTNSDSLAFHVRVEMRELREHSSVYGLKPQSFVTSFLSSVTLLPANVAELSLLQVFCLLFLCVCLRAWSFAFPYLSVCLTVRLSVSPSVSQSICQAVCLSVKAKQNH